MWVPSYYFNIIGIVKLPNMETGLFFVDGLKRNTGLFFVDGGSSLLIHFLQIRKFSHCFKIA